MGRREYRIWTNRILLALTVFTLISGFGITHPGIIEPATFGLLGKSLSYRIHTFLWGPFALFLIIHIYLYKAAK